MSVFVPPAKATIRPSRKIGTFSATVTIDEQAQDDLEITTHPVQRGAAISDHAYRKPATLTVKCGFSDENKPLNEIYADLLKFQNLREPFDVVTGKRLYKNMLLKGLAQTTDAKTENILSITASLQEIIIVEVRTTTVPPRARQARPGATGATQGAGEKKALVEKKRETSLKRIGGSFL